MSNEKVTIQVVQEEQHEVPLFFIDNAGDLAVVLPEHLYEESEAVSTLYVRKADEKLTCPALTILTKPQFVRELFKRVLGEEMQYTDCVELFELFAKEGLIPTPPPFKEEKIQKNDFMYGDVVIPQPSSPSDKHPFNGKECVLIGFSGVGYKVAIIENPQTKEITEVHVDKLLKVIPPNE